MTAFSSVTELFRIGGSSTNQRALGLISKRVIIGMTLMGVHQTSNAEIRSSENHQILSDGLVVAAGTTNSAGFTLFSIVGSAQPNGELGSTNFVLRGGAISVVTVSDNDNDGALNDSDNCPTDFNPGQQNSDNDAQGDACDDDDDGDNIPDVDDNCQFDQNEDQRDTDTDGFGDVCDLDDDEDGKLDDEDNCPLDNNPDQADSDGDGIGDACESEDLCFPVRLQNDGTVLVCL